MLFGLSASVAGSLRAGFVALAVATAVCAWQLRVNRS
jgi:hypothetical protein